MAGRLARSAVFLPPCVSRVHIPHLCSDALPLLSMIRAFLAALLVLSSAALGASADEAYQAAKSDYRQLKGDQKRRALRHHWQNVAKKFEAVATRFPKSERAPEALFNSGELNNELSRFSAKDEDREAAKRSYKKLIEGWPGHKLADGAAYRSEERRV